MTKPPAIQTSKTRPYFPELDGVRAVATLMVMAFHFSQSYWQKGFMMVGQTGVDMFFVLSGFLITTILLQSKPGDWHEVRNFYIRRTLRIFPLYYGYLIGSVLVGAAVSVWYWFYLQNVATGLYLPIHGPDHFWSLASEEQFYLVWPFLVLFLPRRWLGTAMWSILAATFVGRFLFLSTTYGNLLLTLTRPDGLIAGGLLAYYFAKGDLLRYRWLFAALAGVSVLALLGQYGWTHGAGVPWVQATKFAFASLAYTAGMGLLLMTKGTPLHALLRSRPLRGVGRVSYGMYVYHPAIFSWLPGHLGATPLLVKGLLCVAMAYGVAFLSYYSFERWFMGQKDKLAPEPKFRAVKA